MESCMNETVLFAWAGLRSAEVFPQSEPVSTVTNFELKGPRRGEVMSGAVTLIVRIHIAFRASDGQRYNRRADAQFNVGYGTFSVINSDTGTLQRAHAAIETAQRKARCAAIMSDPKVRPPKPGPPEGGC